MMMFPLHLLSQTSKIEIEKKSYALSFTEILTERIIICTSYRVVYAVVLVWVLLSSNTQEHRRTNDDGCS